MLPLRGTLSFLAAFCGSDPQQMDGEAGDDIQHLGPSITPFLEACPKHKILFINFLKPACPLENADKSLSVACVQFPLQLCF